MNAPGEPFLASYLGDSKYTSEPTPGKVTTYRFMSFYLRPSTANAATFMDTVVDPVRRDGSDDPTRSPCAARISGNSVWRVLHRVTCVARVPPQMDGSSMQTTAPNEQWEIVLDGPRGCVAGLMGVSEFFVDVSDAQVESEYRAGECDRFRQTGRSLPQHR